MRKYRAINSISWAIFIGITIACFALLISVITLCLSGIQNIKLTSGILNYQSIRAPIDLTNKEDGQRNYHNEELGLELKMPKNWKLCSEDNQKNMIQLGEEREPEVSCGESLEPGAPVSPYLTITKYNQNEYQKKQYAKKSDTIYDTAPRTVEVSGMTASLETYINDAPEAATDYIYVVAVNYNNYIYLFEYQFTLCCYCTIYYNTDIQDCNLFKNELRVEHEDEFNQILSALKFIEPADTANWHAYSNEKYGFEVKYPDGWSLLDKLGEDSSNYRTLTVSSAGSSFVFNPNAGTPTNYLGAEIQEIKGKIAGKDATIWDWYVWPNTGPVQYNKRIYFENDQNTVLISLTRKLEVGEKFDGKTVEDLETMLSTFKFIESETSDWQTYQNVEKGFEFKYPPDYKQDEGSIIFEKKYPYGGHFFSVSLVNYGEDFSLSDYTDDLIYKTNKSERYDDWKEVEKVGNYEWLRVTYLGYNSSPVFYTQYDDKLYQFSFWGMSNKETEGIIKTVVLSGTPDDDVVQKYKTYTDSEFGYIFEHPDFCGVYDFPDYCSVMIERNVGSGYSVYDNTLSESTFYNRYIADDKFGGLSCEGFFIIDVEENTGNTFLQEKIGMGKLTLSKLKQKYPNSTEITIGNIKGIRIIENFTIVDREPLIYKDIVFLLKDNNVYIIYYHTNNSADACLDLQKPVFDNLIQTFKFTD